LHDTSNEVVTVVLKGSSVWTGRWCGGDSHWHWSHWKIFWSGYSQDSAQRCWWESQVCSLCCSPTVLAG